MLSTRWILTALLLSPALAAAQTEAALKSYFEGRPVTLKLAMPGTESGVDIYPTDPKPLDYPRYAERLKENGTAIRAGQQAMVTKVRVKGTHIEFQLDGGGYGTMGDETSPTVAVPASEKTKREKSLEAELKRETDPDRRRDIKEELDDLRDDRQREDARNRAEVADAQEQKKENIRQRRLEGGSRFNLRFRDSLPGSMLTPSTLQAALAEYVTFEQPQQPMLAGLPTTSAVPGAGLPRKGMTTGEVQAVLGAAVDSSERKEGSLTVITRRYRRDAERVTAEFVEDVVIRYSITSE
ncbi:MAG TPA: hypothetical protein VJQ44_09730 [Gemmatimonadales bacterium]|nr:hypothetical protein [Gemmatimonadales bacterium]